QVLCGLPAQDWFAGGGYFVEAADSCGVRSSLHEIGRGVGFGGDGAHRVNEQITFLFRFGFRRLDHHGAGNDQREGGGVRVEAVIDQALGDVHGIYAFHFLARVAEDDFVHGGQIVGEIEIGLEIFANVVGVEHGVFSSLANSGTVC